MKRGEIWTVSGPGYAGKPRPAVIVQDDLFDATASVAIVSLQSGPVPACPQLLDGERHHLFSHDERAYTSDSA